MWKCVVLVALAILATPTDGNSSKRGKGHECEPSNCKGHGRCPTGKVFDENHCPTCQCADPCQVIRCASGYTCVSERVRCAPPREKPHTPCPWKWQGVCQKDADVSKVGTCPAQRPMGLLCSADATDKCSTDSDCPDILKCCMANCARECVAPIEYGCPPVPSNQFGICPESCSGAGTQGSCSAGQACCSNGCGHTCTDAVIVKAGECPTMLPAFPCTKENSGDECSEDTDCGGSQKCCRWTCGLKCVDPVCPFFKCAECEFGNVMDENNCPTCECNPTPCANVLCPAGEVCQLVDVVCVRAPCYPVPQCVPGPANTVCPVSPPNLAKTCSEPCPSEGCPAGQMQCTYGCGTSCQKACEPVLCKMACTYGFDLDKDGCAICQCYEPCSHCKEDEECAIAVVSCFTTPCWPIYFGHCQAVKK